MMERNTSIDLLKFLAAMLITNSHMASQYGSFSFLAQGGYEGNFIFFFCSGYTLFLKPAWGGVKSFGDWYAKRIRRIYPSLFAVALLSCLIWSNDDTFFDVIIARKYWFVSAIMAQYVVIYLIGSYLSTKIPWAALLTTSLALILFMFWDHSISIWQGQYISRYILSFNAMLLGAYVAQKERQVAKKSFLWLYLMSLIVSYLCVGVCIALYQKGFVYFDFIRAIPLYLLVYSLYKLGMNPVVKQIYTNRFIIPIVRFVGGLSLEIYIVQRYLLSDAYNSLFPFNIVILFLMIIGGAYLVRCIARFIMQLFQEKPLNFSNIISLY